MYASLSSARHHIFFPPRLEVVVEEQNPNGFPSHAGNQSSFHRFLGHQSHGQAGAALGRRTAPTGDDPLLLAVVQNAGGARALLVIQYRFETARLVPMADFANGLWV